MAVILGAGAAAVGWGISDYMGGDVSRRDTPVFLVVAISEVVGVIFLLPVLLARPGDLSADPRLLLAALAGVSVTFELGLIYRALSRGSALITAPVGALGAAVAVIVGVVGGNQLNASILIGLLAALIGSMLSTWSPSERLSGALRHRDAAITVAAALSVGATLALLHAAGRVNPYSVTAVQHASTALSAALMAVIVGRANSSKRVAGVTRRPTAPRVFIGLALIAIAGTGGDLGYVTASHRGALSIVAAIGSLYPTMTIALSRVLRGHRASRLQLIGVAVALTGAVLLGLAA